MHSVHERMGTHVEEREIEINGRPARVFQGGEGAALLLIHGGWGGALMHWSPVWDRLAENYRVIAPDLPGLGAVEQPALGSVREYVAWLVALLDRLGVAQAIFVGNSFGGSVAWSLAGRAPERCTGLVIVDGFPMPATPKLMLWLGHTRAGRALLRNFVHWYAYRPDAVAGAFADVSHAPPELLDMLSEQGKVMATNFATILIEGDNAPTPQVAPHFLWGQEDHLDQSEVSVAHKLNASMPGSTLEVIPDAGHFPQIEAPDAFVKALQSCIGERRPVATWQGPVHA